MNLTGSLDCQCGNASPRHAMATNAIVAMNTRAPNWLFSAIESFVKFLPKWRTISAQKNGRALLSCSSNSSTTCKCHEVILRQANWDRKRPVQRNEERNGSNLPIPRPPRHLVALPTCCDNLSHDPLRGFPVAD